MAEQAKRKNSPSGRAGKNGGNSQAKPKPAAASGGDSKKSSAPKNENNQFWSIILFALGVLIALMTFIKGSSGWYAIHKLLLGLFGAAVIFVPIILIYTSVQIGMEKSQKKVSGRAVWGVAMTFLASAALQVFFVGSLPGDTFFSHFSELYKNGIEMKGGGVASILIAGPLLGAFGSLGAKIITVIMFFVFGMLLSGLGIIDFFKLLTKPFHFIGDCLEGFQNMLMGGDFDDPFEDDDIDDESEKMDFDKDLEAIDIVNSKNKSKPEMAEIKVPPEVLARRNAPADDFLLDIPLPTDDQIVHTAETPDLSDIPVSTDIDENLEKLITKAAEVSETELDTSVEKADDDEEKEKVYILPPFDLLSMPSAKSNSSEAAAEMREKSDTIKNTLKSFGVEVKIMDILRGPSITRYEIQPGAGVKVQKIRSLEDDISLNLAAAVRIEAPVPGKPVVGIEVPNTNKDMVTLREILQSPEFHNSQSKLTFAVGRDIAGNIILGDISKMPHVIIAGTTGSGKSVCTRSIIMSILYNARPDEVKLILIDPKMVEFKVFDGIPHLLIPIVIDAKKAAGALNWAVNEMMRRYRTFSEIGANDLKSYNYIAGQDELEPMPQIVVFIDELADMMLVAGKEVEDSICRLAQMGRAAGMHLVVATQRPTTDVITGLIKANIPSRIALSVMSQVDSRTIIDMAGADKLLGNGDMLYMPIGMNKPVRIQGCFSSNEDIATTVNFIKDQVQAEYDTAVTEAVDNYVPQTKGDKDSGGADVGGAPVTDEDYIERAIEVAVNAGQLSTTMLQKKLKLGYARASRIMDELEEMGVIGPSEGSKPRKVYMSKMQLDERRLRMQEE